MSVFTLVTVILSLPHCCLSLWKHFISIFHVHSRTWCYKVLHTLQYSVFTSSWRSFFNSSAPSAPSLHFRNTFSVLSYMCISYSSSLISSRLSAFQYFFNIYIRLLTHTLISSSAPTARFVSSRFLVHWFALQLCPHAEGSWWCIWQWIYKSFTFLYKFVIHIAKVKNNTITLYALFSEPFLLFYYSSPTEDPLAFCLLLVWWGHAPHTIP